MPNKLTTEEFVQKAKTVHGELYDYSKTIYEISNRKVIIACKFHGDFLQKPNCHLSGQGCNKCGIQKNIDSRKVLTEEFVNKAIRIHGDLYDYRNACYINNSSKITIICKKHGEFLQTPRGHLLGNGCRECANISAHSSNDEFIKKSSKVHGNLYDYSKVKYISSKQKVIIICKKHGEFLQRAGSHLRGNGCDVCGGTNKKNTKEFIKECKSVYGDLYDYEKTKYVSCSKKIIIVCKKHGEFLKEPAVHLGGQGCQKCSLEKKYFVSTLETEWLNFVENTKNIKLTRQYIIHVNSERFVVDGYCKETNTIYEFNGDYWHGNPKIFNKEELNKKTSRTFGQLYEKTIEKKDKLVNAGYNVVSIWESDFKKLNII